MILGAARGDLTENRALCPLSSEFINIPRKTKQKKLDAYTNKQGELVATNKEANQLLEYISKHNLAYVLQNT